MEGKIIKKIAVTVILAFVIQLVITPGVAEANYRSHYDEYPGNDSIPWGTIILIGIAGGVTIAVLALAISNEKEDKETGADSGKIDENESVESENEEGSSDAPKEASEEISMSAFKQKNSKLDLYFDLGQTPQGSRLDKPGFDLDGVEVKVGVALSF